MLCVTWLEELRVELPSTGARLPGVLPGADRRVVGLLRLAPGCGRPEHRGGQSVLVIMRQTEWSTLIGPACPDTGLSLVEPY